MGLLTLWRRSFKLKAEHVACRGEEFTGSTSVHNKALWHGVDLSMGKSLTLQNEVFKDAIQRQLVNIFTDVSKKCNPSYSDFKQSKATPWLLDEFPADTAYFPRRLTSIFRQGRYENSYLANLALPTHIFTFQKRVNGAPLRDVDASLDLFRRFVTGVDTWCGGVPMHTLRSQNFSFF